MSQYIPRFKKNIQFFIKTIVINFWFSRVAFSKNIAQKKKINARFYLIWTLSIWAKTTSFQLPTAILTSQFGDLMVFSRKYH